MRTYLFVEDKVSFKEIFQMNILLIQPEANVVWATNHEDARKLFYEYRESIVFIGMDGCIGNKDNELDTVELTREMRGQTDALILGISDTADFHPHQIQAGCDSTCFKSKTPETLRQWLVGLMDNQHLKAA